MPHSAINTIIFDLGGVLIDWNPVYLYRTIFPNDQEMHTFLETICTSEWNEEQDAGRSLQEATDYLLTKHPEYQSQIQAYYGRWEEMLGGEITGTVEMLTALKKQPQYKLYALTNWSGETFPIALKRFAFLHWFDGIVVSGDEKTRKPFADIYHLLLNRFAVDPQKALFIDDNARNIKGAEACGIQCIHFQSPDQLKSELHCLGIEV